MHAEEFDALRYQLELKKLEADLDYVKTKAAQAKIELQMAERDRCRALASSEEAKVYHFIGPVDEESVTQAILTLSAWSRMDPQAPMTLVLNTPGGSVTEGLALVDLLLDLRANGHRITTVARGRASSMGGVILQGGDHRLIGRNAHMLIHEVSSTIAGKSSNLEDEVEFLTKLQDRCLAPLSERSKLTKREVRERWARKDWWLSATEAVKLSFADAIG